MPGPNVDHPSPKGSGIDRCEVPLETKLHRSLVWARFAGELGDDSRLHACALAYLADPNPVDAVATSHPRASRPRAIGGPPTESRPVSADDRRVVQNA